MGLLWAQATGQEDPVPRFVPRAVVTTTEDEATAGTSTTTEVSETTEAVATTGTAEAAADIVMTLASGW